MTTAYKPNVKPAADRCAMIEKRRAEATTAGKTRREFKFRTGEDLPLITLPVGEPVYRIENYRTRDRQLSMIADGKVDRDAFRSDHAESDVTQQLQHELLLVQARLGSGETIKPIYDELASVAEQTEDIIISADGVVVNGNRRLSAMRELYALDPDKFKRFTQVLCAVLPASATREEILQLEIGLQMQPETKLPYEWTALGRAVRDLRDAGQSDTAIAKLMNRDKADVVRAARMIDSADIYLDQWLKRPDSYDLLSETEQAFRQVAVKNLAKADDAALREVTRKVDFFVIEARDHLTDRAYLIINTIEDNAERFLEGLAEECGIELPVATPADTEDGIVFESAVPVRDYAPLLAHLESVRGNRDATGDMVRVIEQMCDTIKGQGREHAALEMARKAAKLLQGIDIGSAPSSDYEDILTAIDACVASIDRVVAEVQARQVKAG